MVTKSYHCIDGAGNEVPTDPDRDFDPKSFERAIRGQQELVFRLPTFDNDEYEPTEHKRGTEDGRDVLYVERDTLLYDAINILPRDWDTTIVIDAIHDDSYCVRRSVDCGGGVRVYANILVNNGLLNRIDIGNSTPENPDETAEAISLSPYIGSRDGSYLHSVLEREIDRGYAYVIESAATAFDYLETKNIRTSNGDSRGYRDTVRDIPSQSEWAQVRGKTRQTVSNNVRSAQENLYERHSREEFRSLGPALIQIDPDEEDGGDVRLV